MSVSGTRRKNILIVEERASLASVYRSHLEAAGFHCRLCADPEASPEMLPGPHFGAIILSLETSGDDHLSHIAYWAKTCPGAAIIVIAANASINDAVDAVRAGAWDYLVKPVSRNRLITTLTNACCAKPASKIGSSNTEAAPAIEPTVTTMIGTSQVMAETRKQIAAIAASSAAAFITGESGTGKELCAQSIHELSSRRDKPFIALNCGAIPHDLMESEIFGHLKGAFTGAIADREGAAAAADGGTLFLDEICEMALPLQIKLLRFLQTGTIQPVGSPHSRKVDIRIICATNRNPQEQVAAGNFREDLYFRLHVLPVHLEPLRARGSDIIELANRFLTAYAAEENRSFTGLSDCAQELLTSYRWPGNIRELQNIIRHAVVLHDCDVLDATMLPQHLAGITSTPGKTVTTAGRQLWQIERDAIEGAISSFAGSIPKAADALGISPSTIYRKREGWIAKPA